MKKTWNRFTTWLFAPTGRDVDREVDMINNTNIYYISLIVGIVQLISLSIFVIINFNSLGKEENFKPFINVSLSIVLCAVGFIISRIIRKNEDLYDTHRIAVKAFFIIFVILLVVWGMFASVRTFINGAQMLTFYTVELLVVLLIKFKPALTAAIILGSYTVFYCVLEFFIKSGQLNFYNYCMLAALSVTGAVMNYRLTVNYIEEKNKANCLNDSLEIIANHDSMTRLKNRYALNQVIPEYYDTDVCLAMGDVDRFKKINDKYGHRMGDEVLITFAEILEKYFDHEELYRYGGDEFLILTRGNDCGGLSKKLSVLNEELGKAKIDGKDMKLSCSFGCDSGCPHDLTEFFDIIMRADKKLYMVKKGFETA